MLIIYIVHSPKIFTQRHVERAGAVPMVTIGIGIGIGQAGGLL
ncbi:hypothetical protein [Rhodoferax sp.]|nr:hypothetical protein [Rhodoferax sp.]